VPLAQAKVRYDESPSSVIAAMATPDRRLALQSTDKKIRDFAAM
jgi:hypothetical protein